MSEDDPTSDHALECVYWCLNMKLLILHLTFGGSNFASSFNNVMSGSELRTTKSLYETCLHMQKSQMLSSMLNESSFLLL